jgi:hypothetical protein
VKLIDPDKPARIVHANHLSNTIGSAKVRVCSPIYDSFVLSMGGPGTAGTSVPGTHTPAIFLCRRPLTRSNMRRIRAAWQPGRQAASAFHLVRGGFMENRALGNSTTASSQPAPTRREGRNVWVLTAYAVSGLALFGVLIYYVSAYITQ